MASIVERRVISLPDSDRLVHFFDQDQADGFVVFEGTDGRREDTRPWVDDALLAERHGAPPTPGQRGCAASHWRLWSEFAQKPGPDTDLLLVSEDDTVFLPEATSVIEAASETSQDYDLMVLSDTWSRLGRRELTAALMASSQPSPLGSWFWTRGGLYRLGRFAGVPWSAGLYLISRGGAGRLTERWERSHWVADDWTYLRSFADIAILRPSCIVSDGDSLTRTEESKEKDGGTGRRGTLEEVKNRLSLRSRATALKLLGEALVTDIRFRRSRH